MLVKHKKMTVSLLSFLCFAGCGAPTEDEVTSDYGEQMVEAETSAAHDATDSTHAQTGEVWVRRQLMVGIAETPVGPTLNRVVTILRVVIDESETGFTSAEETCATRIERPELDVIGSEIPPAFIDSMAINRRAFLRDETAVSFAETVEIQGARLRDELNEPLPDSVDDTRVIDQDINGQPGVTVVISGLIQGEMHLVQRTITHLTGTQDGDTMTGLLHWTSEEQVLVATEPVLEMPVNLTPHADADRSSFVAVKLQNDQSCEEILANEDTLLPPENLAN